jgi:hypothetical protein
MSMQFPSNYYAGSNLIDGDLSTPAANNLGLSQWMEVTMPANTHVGYVAIHYLNAAQAVYMNANNVYLSPTPMAAQSTTVPSDAVLCGNIPYPNQPDTPVVLSCAAASTATNHAQYLIVQSIAPAAHYHVIYEVVPYVAQ